MGEIKATNGGYEVHCPFNYYEKSDPYIADQGVEVVVRCDKDKRPVLPALMPKHIYDFPKRSAIDLPEEWLPEIKAYAKDYAECMAPNHAFGHAYCAIGATYKLDSMNEQLVKVWVKWFEDKELTNCFARDWGGLQEFVIRVDEAGKPVEVVQLGDDEVSFTRPAQLKLDDRIVQKVLEILKKFCAEQAPDIVSEDCDYEFYQGVVIHELTQDSPSVVKAYLEWRVPREWGGIERFMIKTKIDEMGTPLQILELNGEEVEISL